jgi:Ser/Thr protein kinase RdoA (MazF antagonist)
VSGQPGVDDSLAAGFAPLDAADAVRIAADVYGLGVSGVHRFETERDDTFLLEAGDDRLVLKVAHPADHRDVIDMQCCALEHVAAADPGLPVPRVVPTAAGAAVGSVPGAEGEPRAVRLLTYLPGRLLDYATTSAAQRRAVGAAIGRLSVAMEGFDHPGADRALAWDLQRLGSLRPQLEAIADDVARADVEAELDHFDRVTGPGLRTVRHQVVHNDVNVDNVVVDDDGWVCGILDFGDMVRTAVVADLAVAMAYAVVVGDDGTGAAGADPWGAPYDLAEGFEASRPLADDERSLLPHLVRARMAQRMLVNSWLATTNPGNAHHTLRANGHAIAALRRLRDVPPPPDRAGG